MKLLQQDRHYAEFLKRVNRTRTLCNTTDIQFDLPQICVIGDQSSGKSSLLSALTGVSFPTGTGTCTRSPIVVECTKADDAEVPSTPQGSGDVLDPATYGIDASHEASYELVRSDSGADQAGRTSCDRWTVNGNAVSSDKVADCISQANEQTSRGLRGNVSRTPVNVGFTSLDIEDITLVDLPGIVHRGDEKDRILIEQMTREYVTKGNNTIIVVVTPADTDAETVAALQIAEEADPDLTRTMIVYTKCDALGKHPERQQSVESEMRHSITEQSDKGKKWYHPPHAVSCRPTGRATAQADDADIEESDALEAYDFDKARCGVPALRARLVSLLSFMVQQTAPGLRAEIDKRIAEVDEERREIGDGPVEGHRLVDDFRRALLAEQNPKLEQLATGACDAFVSDISKDEIQRCTITEARDHLKLTYFQVATFQGHEAFDACMADRINKFENAATNCLRDFGDQFIRIVEPSLPKPSCDEFREVVLSKWQRIAKDAMVRTKRRVMELSKEERDGYCTANHYYCDIGEIDVDNEALIDHVAACLASDDYEHMNERVQAVMLIRTLSDYVSRMKKLGIRDRQAKRIAHAVESYTKVMRKSFIDNFLKAVRSEALLSFQRWASDDLPRDTEILHRAKEDKEGADRRARLEHRTECLRQCKRLWEEHRDEAALCFVASKNPI